MLENALNNRLTQALAGNHLIPDDNFDEWVVIVNKVAQKVEMADQRCRWTAGRNHSAGPSRYSNSSFVEPPKAGYSLTSNQEQRESLPVNEPRQPVEMDESGDTIMGGINNAVIGNKERRRAKWKSRAEIDRLRQEGKCFRCERRGCNSRNCPLLPARKPKNFKINVNSLVLPEIDPSVYSIDEVEEMESGVPEN